MHIIYPSEVIILSNPEQASGSEEKGVREKVNDALNGTAVFLEAARRGRARNPLEVIGRDTIRQLPLKEIAELGAKLTGGRNPHQDQDKS